MSTADFKHYARAAGILSMMLGAAVALGWLFDLPFLKSILPGLSSMKLNSAICFMLAGLALHTHIETTHTKRRVAFVRASTLACLALACATMLEHLSGLDLSIDQWLIADPSTPTSTPGRMSSNTALCFMLLSASLLCLDARHNLTRGVAQACALASFSLAFVAVVGYAYGLHSLYGVSGYGTMAIHTALGLLVLSAGVLAARPHSGVFAVLTHNEPAGVVSRRVAPLLLAAPFSVGWLCLHGKLLNLYSAEFGFALMVFASTTLLVTIWLWQARAQSALQAEQRWVERDQGFLIEIGDMLRARVSPDDTLHQVACRLAEYMNVSRCFFSEQDESADLTITHHDYCAKDLPSFAGTRRLSSFPEQVLNVLRAGHVLVGNDLATDPNTAQDYERAYRPIGMRARVAVPLLRGGVWVGTLLVSTHEPHVWSGREIALVEDVAEKTWVWFEHLRMLVALQEREQDLAVTMSSIGDGLITSDREGNLRSMNPVAERLTGWSLEAARGKPLSEVFRVVYEDSRAAVESPIDKVLHGRAVAGPAERRLLIARDGNECPIAESGAAIRSAGGEIRGVVLVFRDTTLERNAARALEESEARKSGILSSAFDAIVSMDPVGTVLEWNPAAERLFGMSRDEAVGHSMASLLVAAGEPGATSGPTLDKTFELTASRKDGATFEAEIVVTRAQARGRPLFTAFVRDISERQRLARERDLASEALQTSEKRFRALVDASAQIVWSATANGAVIEDSPSWRAFTGQNLDEWRNHRLDVMHPDDIEVTRQAWSNARQHKRMVELECRIRRHDGVWRWMAMRGVPVSNPDGSIREWVGMNIDISERRALEETRRLALAESEERSRILIEGARDYAIIMLDPDGKVTTWNAGAERIKGYRPSEIIGRHFSIFYTAADLARQHPESELEQAREYGRYEEEGWRVRKDGTRFWANVVISALRDHDGQLRGFAKVTRDFTERQRARADLEAREASLATSLKERELLLQEVHHRVKNNLQVIASLISMQIRKLSDKASRDALDECRARVQAIALIHEQLYRSHDFSSVPFSAYARNLAANVFQAAGLSPASIKLQLTVESVVLPVDKAIPCGLILNELLTNALKHAFPNERHGSVSVELLPTTEGGISLVVADDGVGISEDFSIEKSRSLGMQLVLTLVEQLGGQISIKREGGTAFGITIPADVYAA